MDVVPPLKRDFGQEHFSAASLGDQRRTRRLCQAANRRLEQPTGALPQRMNNHAQLTALYRLMDCPAVTHASILEAHRPPQKTLQAMGRQRTGRAREDLSVYGFYMMLGGLCGHLKRKGDGFSGWLTLWRGWADLMLMVKGVEAMRGKDV